MKMTRPIGIDEVLEERKAIRQEKQARIATRRAAIIDRLSPSPSWSRWGGTALALRNGIAEARKAAGLTQAEAGLLVGVSLRTYRDYEAAKTDLQCAKVIQLAALLGVTVTVDTSTNGQNSAHSERPADAGNGSHDAAAGAVPQAAFATGGFVSVLPEEIAAARRLTRVQERLARLALAAFTPRRPLDLPEPQPLPAAIQEEIARLQAQHAGEEGYVVARIDGTRWVPEPTPQHGSRDVAIIDRVNDVRIVPDAKDDGTMRRWLWDVAGTEPTPGSQT